MPIKKPQSRVGKKFDSCVRKVSRTNEDGAKAICAATMNRKYPGELQKAAARARLARRNPAPDQYAESFKTVGRAYSILRWYDPATFHGYTLQWFPNDFVAVFYRSRLRKDGDPGWGWKVDREQHDLPLRGGSLQVSIDQMRAMGIAGYQTLMAMGERMKELIKARARRNPMCARTWLGHG